MFPIQPIDLHKWGGCVTSEDQATASLLYQTFPQGSQGDFIAEDTPGHNFEYYFVPSSSVGGPPGPGSP